MNDVLRIARLKIALQRAFLGRAILIFTIHLTQDENVNNVWIWEGLNFFLPHHLPLLSTFRNENVNFGLI